MTKIQENGRHFDNESMFVSVTNTVSEMCEVRVIR